MNQFFWVIISLFLAYVTGSYVGSVVIKYFPTLDRGGGIFVVPGSTTGFLVGFPLAYLFFIFLFLVIFGKQNKYNWACVAALPAILLLLMANARYFYIYVLFPIAGWLIGWGIAKLISRPGRSTV